MQKLMHRVNEMEKSEKRQREMKNRIVRCNTT